MVDPTRDSGLPPPVRSGGPTGPAILVAVALVLTLGAVVSGSALLIVLAVLLVAATVALTVVVARRRQRQGTDRWRSVPVERLTARVDVPGLVSIRQQQGELAAIRSLRTALPGCPLAYARELVAMVTGIPAGTR